MIVHAAISLDLYKGFLIYVFIMHILGLGPSTELKFQKGLIWGYIKAGLFMT